MPNRSSGRALIGLGVDVGGAGLRSAAFQLDEDGRLLARAMFEASHSGSSLAESLARCIEALAFGETQRGAAPLALGIAAPGAKTSDGRGIESARNLAPAPRLLDELKTHLRGRGLNGLALPSRLHSDAQAALLGETVVVGGLLACVREALFMGPGSGLAEAMLVGGEPAALGGPRAAELSPLSAEDACTDLEDEASLAGLVRRWRASVPAEEGRELPIERAAEAGCAAARAQLERFAAALVQVIEVRAGLLEDLRKSGAGRPPALLVRTRRGEFFANVAVQAIVVPALRAAAARRAVRLVVPERPASPLAACAGALALTLRVPTPPMLP